MKRYKAADAGKAVIPSDLSYEYGYAERSGGAYPVPGYIAIKLIERIARLEAELLAARNPVESLDGGWCRWEDVERLRDALVLMYDKWENGTPCHEASEDGVIDEGSSGIGNAFRLSADEEDSVLAALESVGIETALSYSARFKNPDALRESHD